MKLYSLHGVYCPVEIVLWFRLKAQGVRRKEWKALCLMVTVHGFKGSKVAFSSPYVIL